MCLSIFYHLKYRARDPDYHLHYNLANLSRCFHYFKCFQDLVIYPLQKESVEHYFIEEISADLTAATVMEGLGTSLAEHCRVHHQVVVK